MNIYIWENIEELTTNYHEGGGLVIITDRTPQEAWDAERAKSHERPGQQPRELTLPPADHIHTSDATEEQIFVFPDTGCC